MDRKTTAVRSVLTFPAFTSSDVPVTPSSVLGVHRAHHLSATGSSMNQYGMDDGAVDNGQEHPPGPALEGRTMCTPSGADGDTIDIVQEYPPGPRLEGRNICSPSVAVLERKRPWLLVGPVLSHLEDSPLYFTFTASVCAAETFPGREVFARAVPKLVALGLFPTLSASHESLRVFAGELRAMTDKRAEEPKCRSMTAAGFCGERLQRRPHAALPSNPRETRRRILGYGTPSDSGIIRPVGKSSRAIVRHLPLIT